MEGTFLSEFDLGIAPFVIYYTGVHPYTLKPVYTARTEKERDNQHRFFFWYKPENKGWIKQTLDEQGRPELARRLLAPKEKASAKGPRKGKSKAGNPRSKRKSRR